MFKYRSKCRWNMLLHIDNAIVEIRPGEEFSSKSLVTSRFLEELKSASKIVKRGRTKIKPPGEQIFNREIPEVDEEINASSSRT
jgi:hypothetical protein